MLKKVSRKLRAFTLVEMLVAIAMFTIVMMAVTQIFGSAFQAYRETRSLQRNLQAAQFAMNLMAKELRTSSVVVSSTANNIVFYDYSQNSCIRYRITGNSVTRATSSVGGSTPDDSRDNCANNPPGNSSGSPLISNVSAGAFSITSSIKSPPSVGKVTIALKVGTTTNNRVIQSSVSLRDYNYTEL